MKRAAAILVVGWVLMSHARGNGMMPLREYRTDLECQQAAVAYNVGHIWNGPQELLPLLEGEVFCSEDDTAGGTVPFGQWYTGGEWKRRD